MRRPTSPGGPPLALRLGRRVARLLPPPEREFLLGDLEELHARRLRRVGEAAAARRYLTDAARSLLARRLTRIPRETLLRPARSPFAPGGHVFSQLPSDFRLALRALRLRPGFSLLVVLTLGLGIGAATTVFALADQVLLRPLPGVRDPGGAAYLEFRTVEQPENASGISALDFAALREATAHALEGLAAYGRTTLQLTPTGEGRPTPIAANFVHGDYFEVLGVRPLRGRLLRPEETGPFADPGLAVVSEGFWTRVLGRAEDVVGRTLHVNGEPVTVVGVAGGGFAGAERGDATDMWIPLSALGTDPQRIEARQVTNHRWLLLRPRPGVSFQAAEAELAQALARLAETTEVSREVLSQRAPRVFPGLQTVPLLRGRVREVLRLMAATGVLVLLIACANVANLLLFRGLGRRGDAAVRRALGASGARVARQELVGSLVLSLLGSAAGFGVAAGASLLFRGERILFSSEAFPGLSLDARVLLFAAAAAGVATVIAGVLPAALAGRVELTRSLREAGGGSTTRQDLLRGGVSAAQLALCVPLLVAALLLTRTLENLYAVDLGLEPEGVVALTLSTGRQPVERHLALLEAARSLPGVESAALDYPGAFWSGLLGRVRLPTSPEDEVLQVDLQYVTPGWFEMLGVVPLGGRTFTTEDAAPGAPARVLVTAALARRLFGETDVVGRTLLAAFGTPAPAEIVGVLGDVRMSGPEEPPPEAVFFPYGGRPLLGELTLLVRPRNPDRSTLDAVHATAAAAFPEFPLPPEPALLSDRIDRQLSEQRLFAKLLRAVAVVALLLAAVGVYGVVAFAVAARRREMAVRLALGSPARRIAALVLGQAGAIVLTGLTVGFAGALALSRVLESRLFGLAPGDPGAHVAGALLLLAAALAACLLPLRAALRVDPAAALREE